MQKFYIRFLAVLLIIGAVSTAAYAVFQGSNRADQDLVFSNNTMLAGLWNSYKDQYWEESTGRTIDKQQNNITTSEGQSYTMLRAVWQSDKPTFDKTWAWTKEQLRREDGLFSWRWGQRTDGSYGILQDVGGQNTASDGDSDIAMALLMATSRWQQREYLDEARTIIKAMWNVEVVEVNGTPYFASNNLEKLSRQPIVINPSYFSPYAFKQFAKVDPDHDWTAVADSSYDLINRSIDAKLDKSQSAGLTPDWVYMDRTTGEISAPNGGNLTTNYGYDAMRTSWRVALDYQWNKDERAKATLEKMAFLSQQYNAKGLLYSIYSHDGQVVNDDEVTESYGTSLGYFKYVDPTVGKKIYDSKIVSLYDQNNNAWKDPLTYYADNWVWFGIGLYNDQLPNLAKDVK